MFEPDCLQTLPITPGVLRLETELTRKLDEARKGQAVALDYTAARSRAALPIRNPTAQPKQAGKRRGTGRNRFVRSA